jgi:hypothetical protein
MSKDKQHDKEVFQQVLKAVQGDNPEHKKATAAEIAKARRVIEGQKKALRKKFNSKQNGGGDDDVIDTGMFR